MPRQCVISSLLATVLVAKRIMCSFISFHGSLQQLFHICIKAKKAIMRHIPSASNSFGGHSNDFLNIGGDPSHIILLILPLSNTNDDFSLDYQMRSLLCTSTKANENSLNVM